MHFNLFHRYQAQAAKGLVPKLTCSTDGFEYVVRVGQDDEPLLHCYSCGSTLKPGIKMYESLQEVLGDKDPHG